MPSDDQVATSQPAWYRAARSSGDDRKRELGGLRDGDAEPGHALRLRARPGSRLHARDLVRSSGRLPAGMEKFGVRWNTVSSAAWSAMIGIDWMPEDPVPTTPTRMPVEVGPRPCRH